MIDQMKGTKQHFSRAPGGAFCNLAWLAEIGFADVDVIWKYHKYAAYRGVKR